jgi:uncharacterized membrane protein
MAHTSSDLPPARHVPALTNQGWPVAFAIILLAIVVNTAVYLVHERTSSRSPIDPSFRAKGAPAPEHSLAAPGEQPAGHSAGQPAAH